MFEGLVQLAPYALSWLCLLLPFLMLYVIFMVRLMKAVKKIQESFHWQTVYQKRLSKDIQRIRERVEK